ncbi:hypothetical protein M422DRAFT_50276 [Sphaerobolus stellatus SS14]|uniref:Uncharacterized protein n=1 Tax=Sphaerobolus stellatus (strain SS14) TaxID=990650 RepID=A0A0C9USA4_SPHS4|nr:hypothetical protein M422DRAFT_50276 [Sphaerobolus stellatus SS14]
MTVTSLLVFEMLHSAFSIHAIYFNVITNFGNPSALLGGGVWSADINFSVIVSSVSFSLWTVIIDSLLFEALNVLFVHLSYSLYIYHVGGKRLIIPIAVVRTRNVLK